jgi:hypothetical protein
MRDDSLNLRIAQLEEAWERRKKDEEPAPIKKNDEEAAIEAEAQRRMQQQKDEEAAIDAEAQRRMKNKRDEEAATAFEAAVRARLVALNAK